MRRLLFAAAIIAATALPALADPVSAAIATTLVGSLGSTAVSIATAAVDRTIIIKLRSQK